MFIDRLIDRIIEKSNSSVIGLDPKLDNIPEFLKDTAFSQYGKNMKGAAKAIQEFNFRIIDAVHDIIPAVKPQMAYYEMYGLEGMKALQETIQYAKEKDLMVILDGKRNDIGSTAQAYSTAYLGNTDLCDGLSECAFDVDALTVNPYLGFDGIKPFIDDCRRYGKGLFILVKTSNKSSGQLQDLMTVEGKSIYEVIAELVEQWGKNLVGKYGYSSIGAVVGATYPNQAKMLRKIMKHAFLLVPGYGAQGGTARDAAHSFNCDRLGALVNASRSVIYAYLSEEWKNIFDEKRFDEASRAEVIKMRDDINNALGCGPLLKP